jgi:tetratricopeptide (TPR) repeat protein
MVAGDYEFFIRLAARYGARHLPDVLGIYCEGGLESQGRQRCREETERILRWHRRAIPLETVYPSLAEAAGSEAPQARAAARVDFGNLAFDPAMQDLELAMHCYEEAASLAPGHPVPVNNLAVALYWEGKSDEAAARLEQIQAFRTARRNLKGLKAKPHAAATLVVDTIPHPVWQTLPPLEPPGSALQKLGGFRATRWLHRMWR